MISDRCGDMEHDTDLCEGCHLAADGQSELFTEELELCIVLPVKIVHITQSCGVNNQWIKILWFTQRGWEK